MRDFRLILILACGLSATPAMAVDCRRSSDPPREIAGRQLDCRGVEERDGPAGPARRGQPGEKGFIDLGNGTSVRISGRVRADTLYRR
ncbi:MAG: hypothetical protein ABWY78_06560 [Microvirga sp.]